ncbi:MAG: hypothetical protein MJ214_05495 [Bacilli bacterium]|nr:hypothetical protein [Bacilli bacterium]
MDNELKKYLRLLKKQCIEVRYIDLYKDKKLTALGTLMILAFLEITANKAFDMFEEIIEERKNKK